MAEEVKGFANLMRYCNTLEDYNQKKADGKVTDDVLVIVLEDKVIKFKGYEFDLSGKGSGEGGSITIDDVLSATSTNPVTSKAIKEYVDLHPQYEKVDEIEAPEIEGIEGLTNFLTEITYNDLVNLRDNNSLIPGMKYRIIDYETTTSTPKTQSAGHVFDIIVTALSSSVLDENARAIQSVRDVDGYFNNSNLSAWRLLYSLDNDTSRFRWAVKVGSEITIDISGGYGMTVTGYLNGSLTLENVTYYKWDASFEGMTLNILTDTETPSEGETVKVLIGEEVMEGFPVVSVIKSELNGFGVIYNMVDEYNNSLPYDFKNIMFSRKLTNYIYDEENGIDTFVYTFNNMDTDVSLLDLNNAEEGVHDNFMPMSHSLPNNVFVNNPEYVIKYYNNIFGVHSINNTFEDQTFNNHLGDNFLENRASSYFNCNYFVDNTWSNTFGESCYGNTCYEGFHENIIGNDFVGNITHSLFANNIIGNNCKYCEFKYDSSNITLVGTSNCFFNNCIFADVEYTTITRSDLDPEATGGSIVENVLFWKIKGTSSNKIEFDCAGQGSSNNSIITKLNTNRPMKYKIENILSLVSGTEL